LVDLEDLLQKGKIAIYKKGEIIKLQGEPIEEILILLEGLLSTEHISDSGKSLEIDTIKPIKIIASGLIFSREPKYPATVTAKEESKILHIERKDFLDILMKRKDILFFFLEDISEHFRMVSEKLFLLSTKTLKERLLYYLIQHANEDGYLVLNVTIEDLSKMFGCARPALSRVLQDLIREGIIEKAGRRIRILRKDIIPS